MHKKLYFKISLPETNINHMKGFFIQNSLISIILFYLQTKMDTFQFFLIKKVNKCIFKSGFKKQIEETFNILDLELFITY